MKNTICWLMLRMKALTHTEASSMEGRMGRLFKEQKKQGALQLCLHWAFQQDALIKGNQQEAPSSQMPGRIHPTCGPALLSGDHILLKHWPRLLCSHLSLFRTILPASLSDAEPETDPTAAERETGPPVLCSHTKETIWLIPRSFPGQTHANTLPHKPNWSDSPL